MGEGRVVEEVAVAAEDSTVAAGSNSRIDNIGKELATTVASVVTTTSTRYPTRELMVKRAGWWPRQEPVSNPVRAVRDSESERWTCFSYSRSFLAQESTALS